MLAGETYLPRVRLERCHAVERVLVGQVDVIDSMTPQDFLQFRTKLAPASGFQSSQFREIEFLSGLKDPTYLRRFRGLSEGERARLQRRLDEPSLWDGFLAVLATAGCDVTSEEDRFTAYKAIANDRERYGALWDLAEALVDHDQARSLWRAPAGVVAGPPSRSQAGCSGRGAPALPASSGGRAFFPGPVGLRTLFQ